MCASLLSLLSYLIDRLWALMLIETQKTETSGASGIRLGKDKCKAPYIYIYKGSPHTFLILFWRLPTLPSVSFSGCVLARMWPACRATPASAGSVFSLVGFPGRYPQHIVLSCQGGMCHLSSLPSCLVCTPWHVLHGPVLSAEHHGATQALSYRYKIQSWHPHLPLLAGCSQLTDLPSRHQNIFCQKHGTTGNPGKFCKKPIYIWLQRPRIDWQMFRPSV